jgi:hypothetical protein
MTTIHKDINPTVADTSYDAGDIWSNDISYSRYVFTTGSTWVPNAPNSGVVIYPNEANKLLDCSIQP